MVDQLLALLKYHFLKKEVGDRAGTISEWSVGLLLMYIPGNWTTLAGLRTTSTLERKDKIYIRQNRFSMEDQQCQDMIFLFGRCVRKRRKSSLTNSLLPT